MCDVRRAAFRQNKEIMYVCSMEDRSREVGCVLREEISGAGYTKGDAGR